VSGDGIPQSPIAGFDIAGSGTTGKYTSPDLAYSATLGYLVAFVYESPATKTDVLGRFVWAGHDAAAGEPFPLFDFSLRQEFPQVACAPDAHCLIVEHDYWDPEGLNRWGFRGLLLGPCPRVFVPLVVRNP
jgi:hypothetical protein